VLEIIGAPYGNRTRVSAVKGRRPGPLDEGRGPRANGAVGRARHIKRFAGCGKEPAAAGVFAEREPKTTAARRVYQPGKMGARRASLPLLFNRT
jgi:hypothetical protein